VGVCDGKMQIKEKIKEIFNDLYFVFLVIYMFVGLAVWGFFRKKGDSYWD